MRIPLQLLGTVVFLFPSTQLGAQQIGGTVIDIVTGDPVPAVTVELVDTTSAVVLSVEADDAGRFVLAVTAPGAYEIAAHHDCSALAQFFWIGWEGAVLRAKLERSAVPLQVYAQGFFQLLTP